MQVNCKNCGKLQSLDKDQISLVETLRKQGNDFGMLQCKFCGLGFSINPQDLSKEETPAEEIVWRSPIAGSHGYVTFVEGDDHDDDFYGCGETGVVWFTKESLYEDIELIINKYHHRTLLYEKVGKDWFPMVPEPENIDELIDSEGREIIDTYQR